MSAELVLALGLFLASLLFFVVAVVYYSRARLFVEAIEAEREATRVVQEDALAAQREALDLAAIAREYVL